MEGETRPRGRGDETTRPSPRGGFTTERATRTLGQCCSGPWFQTRAIVPLWDMWPHQETFWVVTAGGTREPANVPVPVPAPSVCGAEAEKVDGSALPLTDAFLHTPR